MPDAPITVTLEDYPGLPAPSALTVECAFADVPNLARGFSPEQLRRKQVAEDRLEELASLLDPGAGETAAVARSATPKELLSRLEILRTTRATLVVRPLGAGTVDVVVAALSLGVPVELRPDADWDEATLLAIAEYFLHSPALSTGLSPLLGVVEFASGSQRTDLWELEGERLGRNFHVDGDGRVSLSARWAEKGAFFGRVGDPLDRLQQSEPWRWLESLHRRVFVETARCATCRHYLFCKGFFLSPASPEPACGAWRACLDRVADTLAPSQRPAASGA